MRDQGRYTPLQGKTLKDRMEHIIGQPRPKPSEEPEKDRDDS
jgi:hypothetical protein